MPKEQPQQLQDHAFSLKGHAYQLEDVFIQRPVPFFVTAKKPSSITWRNRLEAIGTNACPAAFHNDVESIPANIERGEADYVVVGVIPLASVNNEELQKTKRGAVGLSLPMSVLRPESNPAIRVVVQKAEETTNRGLKLYALTDVDPQLKLCNAFVAQQDSVFFFSEYRTSATNYPERRKEWIHKVAGIAIGGKERYLEPGKLQPYMNDPTKQLVDDLHMLFAKFDLDAEASNFLGGVKDRLKGTEFADLPAYVLTKLWLCVDGEFTHENAEALSEQIKPIWPGVRYVVSPKRLTDLHQALCRKGLRVEFSHAYLFMSYGCSKLAIGLDTAEKIATDGAEFAKTMHGGNINFDPHLPHTNRHELGDAIQAVAERLTSAYTSTRDEANAVEAMHGNKTSTLTLDEMYKRLGHAVDGGEIRLLNDQILSLRCHEISKSLRRNADLLESLTGVLAEYAAMLEGNH